MDAKQQEREFHGLLARTGLTPSRSDRDAALPIALELMRSAEMMRRPRRVDDPPAYIHALAAILKATPK